MLIGNRERFAFETVPVAPGWERRYEAEAAGWAGLAVWVEGKNLCANIRVGEGEIRQHLYVLLGPVADWVVRAYPGLAFEERAPLWSTGGRLHEAVRQWGERRPPFGIDEDLWLDSRETFWGRHFLAAGAEGARLPNLAVLRQDDEAALFWATPHFAVKAAIEFLHPAGQATVAWSDLEQPLRSFVCHVGDVFKQAGHVSAFPWLTGDLGKLFGQTPADALGFYCARSRAEIADLLGVSPDHLPDVLQLANAADPSTSPVCQTLRDLPPVPTPGIGQEILATVAVAAEATPLARGRWQEGRARALDYAMAGATPHEQGQLAAQGLRELLRLGDSPIAEVPDLAGRFGTEVRVSAFEAANERMLIAVPRGGSPVVTVLRTGRTSTRWGQRFEQARGLGHAVVDPLSGDALGAASSPYAQQRRRMRSGAFAAELLLPAATLEKASGGLLDGARSKDVFSKVLATYGVGARTAAHQLFNHGWLSSTSVRDELIDKHAAP